MNASNLRGELRDSLIHDILYSKYTDIITSYEVRSYMHRSLNQTLNSEVNSGFLVILLDDCVILRYNKVEIGCVHTTSNMTVFRLLSDVASKIEELSLTSTLDTFSMIDNSYRDLVNRIYKLNLPEVFSSLYHSHNPDAVANTLLYILKLNTDSINFILKGSIVGIYNLLAYAEWVYLDDRLYLTFSNFKGVYKPVYSITELSEVLDESTKNKVLTKRDLLS